MKCLANIYKKVLKRIYSQLWRLDVYVIKDPQLSEQPGFKNDRYEISNIQDLSKALITAFIADYAHDYRWTALIEQRLQEPDNFHGHVILDRQQQRIVYICWLTLGDYLDEDLDFVYPISEFSGALLLNAYTVPEHRGNGFHRIMMAKRINHCVTLQRDRLFIAVEADNQGAEKTLLHFPFTRWKRLLGIRLSRYCLPLSVTD
jgi:GNAT superfamily N-acetyltransferase